MVTFDGYNYTFQGICKYIISSSKPESTKPKLQVFITYTAPSMNGTTPQIEYVEVHICNIEFKLARDKKLYVSTL